MAASLEFFGPNPMPKDAALLDMICQAGTQLGRVVERDRANDRLHDALHDSLTSLPNRPHFLREVDQAFREYSLDRRAGFCARRGEPETAKEGNADHSAPNFSRNREAS